MKRIIQTVKSAALWRRLMALLMTGIFVLSAAMTGTLAWADARQHKTNVAEGKGEPLRGDALLQKYELDADGEQTTTAVPGARFTLFKVDGDGTATPLASFVTGADGKILAADLEPGDYYWQETQAPPGYLPESEGGQAKKYPFSVPSEDGKAVVTNAYNIRQKGSLTVKKLVAGKNADPNKEFTFTVVIGNKTETFTLKHGETKTFENLPVGTHYVVTEAPAEGYSTSSENSTGNVPEEGITATFTNTYQAQYGGLTIKKTVTGEDADLSREFTFTAVIGGNTETFTLKHGQSKTFYNIPVGTDYAITETDYSGEDYYALVREYKGTVTLNNVIITLPFTNRYEPPPTPTGSLEVSKTLVEGDTSQQEFTFEVTFAGEGAPTSPQTFTLRGGEKKTFTDIPHGVTYTVRETGSGDYEPDFVTASGTIVGDEKVQVEFINRMPPEYKLTVTKRVEGNPPESDKDKRFRFTLTINGEPHTFELKAGETSQAFKVQPGDVYSLVEEDYSADRYTQSGTENSTGVVGNEDIVIIRVNTYLGPELIDIEVEKKWNADGAPKGTKLPDSVTLLLKYGNTIVETVVVKAGADGKWTHVFRDLPKYDALGNEIAYTVEEVRIEGWMPVYTDGVITNIWQAPVKDSAIEVEKAIDGVPPADVAFTFVLTPVSGPSGGIPMPESNEATVTGTGKAAFGPITYTVPGEYVYTITEKDDARQHWVYDASVYTLTVKVTEGSDGKLAVNRTLAKGGAAAEKAVFTNKYSEVSETINVRVTKTWVGEEEHPTSAQAQLYRDDVAYGDTVTLSEANNWTHIWSDLEKAYTWTVGEAEVPEGYKVSVTGDAVNGFTITNTRETVVTETISVKVSKVWSGEDENRPQSVAVQLYKDGEAELLPVTLSEDNDWKYTWNDLEKGPVWTVNEVNVPAGYSKAIVGDAVNGFVITNTKLDTPLPPDDEVIVSGKKTWNHGESPVAERPEAITVIIMANGDIVTQRRITAAEHWSWSFRLPKFDASGTEIVYTVDEARFENYVKMIDGYNLINTYKPGSDTDDPVTPPVPPPETGDNVQLKRWIVITTLSFAALVILLLPWNRWMKNRRRERA